MTVADRLAPFGVTIFSEMTALAMAHDAINLGQGFPNWDGADFIKSAAIEAIAAGGADQYPPSHGIPALRSALAARYGALLDRPVDPDSEVTVTCGCTEALAATFLGLINPGDEVILVEPFYDAYPAYVAMAGATPKYVTLRPPNFALDLDELAGAVTPQTRLIVVNNPHNPTGRVLTRSEIEGIAEICMRNGLVAVTDEVYEEMIFDGEMHRLAGIDGMWDRTLSLSSIGKTFSLTGWKLGWAVGPPALTAGVRSAHQFMTFTTPSPVQHGAVAAFTAGPEFFEEMRQGYRAKRDLLASGLRGIGFEVYLPQGTYFLMAGHEGLGLGDDRAVAKHLVAEAGVAVIPPSVFYHRPEDGRAMVRFAFCKDEATLAAAVDRLSSTLSGGRPT
jgi:aspartate/methionine/tyrosine aminotransferase